MAQKKVRAAIVSQEKLAEGIFSMWPVSYTHLTLPTKA